MMLRNRLKNHSSFWQYALLWSAILLLLQLILACTQAPEVASTPTEAITSDVLQTSTPTVIKVDQETTPEVPASPLATVEEETLTTPSTSTLPSVKPLDVIYLAARTDAIAQVWQISIMDGGSPSKFLYELDRQKAIPFGTVLPSKENLEAYLQRQSLSLDDLRAEPHIQRLALSPDQKKLAWVEEDYYSVYHTNIWLGVTRVVTLDLASNQIQILLEIPYENETGRNNLVNYGPVWSPDGKYLAITRQAWPDGESFLSIIDVNGESTQEFRGTKYPSGSVLWSSDSSTVAWLLAENVLQLCEIAAKACNEVELKENGGVWQQSIAWSPTAKQIAFVAGFGKSIYLLDIETRLTQRIPYNSKGTVENPRWSPDGRFLALDSRPSKDDVVQSLLVIEPTSGKVVSEWSGKRPEQQFAGLFRADATWGRESNSIAIIVEEAGSKFNLGIFDLDNGSLKLVPLPDELVNKEISSPNW